ncbi:hypothetical protein PoB_003435300 [Plakobranchus ocellatus]|uniref:Uncharacterized protein n=1 Tax=Plakobranchus ocellatus TaxID=259542 RepID=A0AAV4AM29_9GAST|nr:hypothetical protein PoB_003435300 [Plakobranchus ocellatus]
MNLIYMYIEQRRLVDVSIGWAYPQLTGDLGASHELHDHKHVSVTALTGHRASPLITPTKDESESDYVTRIPQTRMDRQRK